MSNSPPPHPNKDPFGSKMANYLRKGGVNWPPEEYTSQNGWRVDLGVMCPMAFVLGAQFRFLMCLTIQN